LWPEIKDHVLQYDYMRKPEDNSFLLDSRHGVEIW